ncbi:hypothetical protein VNO77_02591 [Canavalia gladiata]|uniref:Uncharacterized protein n=1 Tax=Canavalia gladiata TaxID=3824 RepID=A0AAN9MTH3_CANGL
MTFPIKSKLFDFVFNLFDILHVLFFFPSDGTLCGHTIHLIPRDSPLSPSYDPSSTHFRRLHNAFQRSLKRINHIKSSIVSSKGTTQVPVEPSGGDYLMKFSMGTPPVEVVHGPNVITTSIIRKEPNNLYHLTLEALSVGKERIPLANKGENKIDPNSVKENIIIDFGTKVNVLPSDVYDALVSV